MKGLNKLALATAVAAAPFATQAMEPMNDQQMGEVTGQSGVTIELDAEVSVGEIAYQDEGFLAIDNLTIGGAANADGTGGTAGRLDDLKMSIDVVGAGGIADTANGAIGNDYLNGAAQAANVTWNQDGATGEGDFTAIENGDMVIGLRSISGVPVDYGVSVDSVSLAQSTGTVGDLASTAGTTLVSDFDMSGLLGPVDIVINESENMMDVNAYFNAQGTLNADFVGTSLDFELHNRRGDSNNNLVIVDGSGNTVADTSFAHAQVDIGVGSSNDSNVTGDVLAVNVNDFSGDLDLTDITMGDQPAIGDVYMTDIAVDAQMSVYGH